MILCKRLSDASKTGEILNMKYMYAAVTLDIINNYCFAHKPESVLKSDFGRKSFDDIDSFLAVSLLVGAFLLSYNMDADEAEHPHPLVDALHLLLTSKPLNAPCLGATGLNARQDHVNKMLAPAMTDVLDFRKVCTLNSSHVSTVDFARTFRSRLKPYDMAMMMLTKS